ncbi:hypothetical protein QEH45_gp07 [Microbacterium phage Shocker]|uniref:Uncharacterized protein n=1 Tax=Microbacterium phage Shocker TaxID=2805839 RepID=A0A890V1T5_9CAUD|nr:hypothetical protein QEH45_gp07 [Microbacterium phage Shocker]QRI45061.1 hypothetical protein SEA_SHOCKER_7 [Microbacterium phage Shocker]
MSESIRERLAKHAPIIGEQTSNPNYVALPISELRELVELAHEAVHPPEEEDGPEIERGYDGVNLRMQCLQLATQVDINRLHASEGGQWHSDPLGLAEAYYSFLTTKDEL